MRLLAPVAVLALTASAVSACGSSGPAGSTGGNSALARALRTVADTPATRHYVEFGQPAGLLRANGGTSPKGAYAHVLDAGASDLHGQDAAVQRVLGFDINAAHYAVAAGNPPHRGVLLAGAARPATAAKLTGLGATKSSTDSGTVYRFRPDAKVSTSDKLAKALPGATSALDVLRIDGADVRFGASASDVDTTRAASPGLLGYRPFADVAGCLGDPLAAVLTDRVPHASAARSGHPAATRSVGVQAIGVALSGARGQSPTEQLCISADSDQHASAIASAVRAAVGNGRSLAANQPWSTLLDHASVAVHGSTVALTARPAQGEAGVLIQSLIAADLPGVSG
jgi:hypothetical protein